MDCVVGAGTDTLKGGLTVTMGGVTESDGLSEG